MHFADQCPICLDSFTEEMITACGHVFCKACIMGVLNSGRTKVCPLCREPLDEQKLYTQSEIREEEAPENPKQEAEDEAQEEKFESSSKVDAIVDEFKKVREEDPKAKVVIFSQFVGFLQILSKAFDLQGVKTLMLDGAMTRKKKEQSLTLFKGSEFPVMLASLRAAGQGLNLQTASNVFLCDPWVNPFLTFFIRSVTEVFFWFWFRMFKICILFSFFLTNSASP